MLYSLLMEDKQEVFIGCMDEAMRLYLQNKKQTEQNSLLNLFVPKNKFKS